MAATRRLLWVIGPALGHVARSLVVARVLRDAHAIDNRFLGSDRKGFHARLLAPEFATHDTGHAPGEFEAFADTVATHVRAEAPDAVVFDCASLPWRLAMPALDVPVAYLTNAYLVHAAQPTYQDLQWREHGEAWNAVRRARGLPALARAADLFETDRVVMADPPWMLPENAALPAHHVLTGPCAWSPGGTLPAALARLRDVALVSTGSTGAAVPEALLQGLPDACEARHLVQVDSRGVRVDGVALDTGPIPLPALLPHCRVALTQGGAGSTWQALAHGVPVLIWPGHRNHTLLAQRVQAAGLGAVLQGEAWPEQLQAFRAAFAQCRARARAQRFDLDEGARRAAAAIAGLS